MEPNTHSSQGSGPGPGPGGGAGSDRLASLTADVDELATEDLNTLTDVALVEEALELRRLVDCLEGQWLQRLAAIDARGRPGPTKASRWARPRPGCATGSIWAPGPRPASSAPPGPCSGSADGHRRRPDQRSDLGRPCWRAGPRHPPASRPGRERGRAGAAGGGGAAGSAAAAPGAGPSSAGHRPRQRRQPG
jgi:hypothetical protein